MSPTFVDIFCGAGGSSSGLVEAGFELKLAANHWQRAIETHAANHPNADHLCADVNNYDMRRLPKTDVLWASPICTEISPAGGRKRTRGQLALMEYGSVPDAAWERTRATAYDVIRATEVHRYKAVLCENVVEFAVDWELFDWWRTGMHKLGYKSRIVSASSAHLGGDGNTPAAQWRDRIYIVFMRDGIPMPDLELRPRAWCPDHGDGEARQAWNVGRHIGKYRQQYRYVCAVPGCTRVVEPYAAPAASIIDWSNLGTRIGDREAHGKRPLAAKTMARIEAGLAKYGDRRMVVTVNHAGHDGRAFPADEGPLPTRSVKIGEGVLIPCGGTWNEAPAATSEPFRTRTANPKGYEGLLTPFVIEYRNHGGAEPVGRPLATVTAGGNHHGLVIPYRNGSAKPTSEPFLTLATHDSAALVRPARTVDDCYFRMIQPCEQMRAQRFPAEYIVKGNKGEVTMQAGNAVSVNAAHWIGSRVIGALS